MTWYYYRDRPLQQGDLFKHKDTNVVLFITGEPFLSLTENDVVWFWVFCMKSGAKYPTFIKLHEHYWLFEEQPRLDSKTRCASLQTGDNS